MNLDDTIVAVSTPSGAAERAIVRLSGADAVPLADRLFTPTANASPPAAQAWPHCPTYTAVPGRLYLTDRAMTVPATVYLMRRPRSYTCEDVVEFHLGGWPAVVPLAVEALVAAGARPAEAGEFTFRALLNGRLDLAQAEAVMAVVDAGSRAALRAAGDLLAGDLSSRVLSLAESVREVLALVELDLDFSDQDVPPVPAAEIADRLAAVRDDLADLGRRSRGMETYAGAVRLVIAGWPNVGKSSLFNRLLARERAIVTDTPGTTRDEVRATLHRGGLVFTLSDVAGLDEARDALAGKVRARALEAVGRADLVLLALDATAASFDRTDELLSLVAAPMVVAVTKCDRASPDRALAWVRDRGLEVPVACTSAVTGQGVDDLGEALAAAVTGGEVDREAAGPVVTARHRAALERAAVALARAHRQARRSDPAGELVALELGEALDALAAITGCRGNVLETIFARFCIGK
jgi:tRNA modification GTPase